MIDQTVDKMPHFLFGDNVGSPVDDCLSGVVAERCEILLGVHILHQRPAESLRYICVFKFVAHGVFPFV